MGREPNMPRHRHHAEMEYRQLRMDGRHPNQPPPKGCCLWARADVEVLEDPDPVWGQYPKGFLRFALRHMFCDPAEVLHVCSGALSREAVGRGIRIDLAARARPDIRADGRALPFKDESFAGVLLDPPYTKEYARELYDTDYPRPSHLLREAARVLRPGGRIGILHFIMPYPPPGCRYVTVVGISTGCGYALRAFSIFVKLEDQGELFGGGD